MTPSGAGAGAGDLGRIAVVEDDPIMGESLRRGLELEGWHVAWWRNGAEAVDGIASSRPDLVVCDIRLPDMSGEEVFRRVGRAPASPSFIFMTAFAQIEQAIALVRAGAEDYLTKPFDFGVLLERARRVLTEHPPRAFDGSLGRSDEMRDVELLLRRIAPRMLPVLLCGETGTGKDVCARFLHSVSPRATEPFMAVNCAAIPPDLLESEVFGHERGAFTGAQQRHLGYAERAGAGTLFLDEIGEMPPALQAKLLRVVEERSFHRVGGQTAIPLRARLVCATNRDLPEAIRSGRFREDLYYRVNTLQVDLPPLRERPADVAWLLSRFLDGLAEDAGHLRGVSKPAVEAAEAHAWPGNVRELRNRVERAVALSVGPWLTPADLFPEKRSASRGGPEAPSSLAAVRDAAERRQIDRALRDRGGQVGEAAKSLGVSRTTLWEKMRKHGFPDQRDGRIRPPG